MAVAVALVGIWFVVIFDIARVCGQLLLYGLTYDNNPTNVLLENYTLILIT